MTGMKHTGFDYHKRDSVVCIVDDVGTIVAEERIEHDFPKH